MHKVRRIVLAALAVATVGLPALAADAQAAKPKYVVTSIKQFAPNTLAYLISHWTGAASFEAKMRTLESKMGVDLAGAEGPEGRQGIQGVAGPAGPQGESIEGPEGPEGRASTIPGPAGLTGERGEAGEAGPEGAASTVAGPQGERGERGERGPACNATEEVACRSTVPGPQGDPGPEGKQGPEGKASTVPGPAGPAGPRGETGPAGPAGEGSSLPTTYTAGLGFTGKMTRGQEFTMFSRMLPPGDYLVTGNISFENRNEGQVPESILCRILLGGNMIDQTPTIASSIAVAGRNNSSAVVVASTGQITHEESLEVKCINVSQNGPQEEFPQFGQLAATAVSFH